MINTILSISDVKRIRTTPKDVPNGTIFANGGLSKSKTTKKEDKKFNVGDIIKVRKTYYCIISIKNNINKKFIQKHYEIKLMAITSRHITELENGNTKFTPRMNNEQKYACIFLETSVHTEYTLEVFNSFEFIDKVDYICTFLYGKTENKLNKVIKASETKYEEYFDFNI